MELKICICTLYNMTLSVLFDYVLFFKLCFPSNLPTSKIHVKLRKYGICQTNTRHPSLSLSLSNFLSLSFSCLFYTHSQVYGWRSVSRVLYGPASVRLASSVIRDLCRTLCGSNSKFAPAPPSSININKNFTRV